jgi:hypothetical protein
MFRIAFRFRAALLLATVAIDEDGPATRALVDSGLAQSTATRGARRITISSIAERCFFFLPRGRRCPHRGLATRWAVVARGPSLDIHARHLDSTTRTSARSRVSRLSSRCGTGRAAHRHTHTSHRACRPGPSATPHQTALSMTPLTQRSSQPLRDYMLRTRDNG